MEGGGGHTHARNCGLFVASCIESHEQAEARRRNGESRQVEGEPFDFYITNNMFDETRLYLSGFGRSTKRQRVLAASGQVTWKPANGFVQDADVFRSPTVLRNYTAAHCATVVSDPLDPTSLYPGPNDYRPLAKYRGSLQATDQHSVNVLMEKVTVQRQTDLDDGTSFELTCFCTQHKTGNVVEEVTKFLGLLSPSFCIASCLSQGDLGEEVEAKLPSTLDCMLDVVDPTEREGLSERDKRLVAFSQELMTQCYVNDVQRDQDCEDDASRTRSFHRRSQESQDILSFFPCPWSGRLIHLCPPGCCGELACADRSLALQKACGLVTRVAAPSISTPAANKYTKVDPVVRKIALLTNFFGILRRMVGQKLGRRVENEDGDGFAGVDDDTVIGIPANEKDHYKKLGQVKLRKIFDFLSDPASKYLPLVWLVVCSPIMIIHYFLFKHGTWYNRRDGNQRCNIFDFCGALERNPVCSCLCQIAAMLMDPLGGGAPGLKLLRLRFGNDMRPWPRRLLAALTVALCLAFCILWRKLFHAFDCYPWRLAAGVDVQRSEEARRTTIKEFLDANICCLDLGLGQPLRLHAPFIDDYFDTALEEFLRVLFERVVVTSTQVELQFAKLSLWTNVSGGSRLGLPALGAKAKNTAYKNAVEQWRRALPGDSAATANLSRPEWTKSSTQGSRTSYLHLYVSDLLAEARDSHPPNLGEHWTRAAASFHELPPERQEQYKHDARLSRCVASSSQLPPLARAACPADDVVEGPLGIASRTGFPMRASAVAAHQRKTKFADVWGKWVKAHKSKIEASADYPDSVESVRVCVGKCTQSMFDDGGEQSMTEHVAHLFEYIRLVLLYFPATDSCADPTLLLQFVSDVETLYVLVVHPQHLNQFRFTAEFIMLRPVSDAASVPDAVHVLPMQLAFAPGRVVLGVRWPHINDELQFVSRLLQTASEWTISKMTKSIVALGQWLVTDHTAVSFEDAKAREAVVKAQRASLAAMKKAMGLIGHKAPGRFPRRPNHKRTPETEDALRASKNKKGGGGKQMSSSDSAGSAATDEETSCDEHWTSIMAALRKQAAAKARITGASEGPLADDGTGGPLAHDETSGPLAADSIAAVRAIAGERVLEAHGLSTLAAVTKKGVLVAFEIRCRGHNNDDDGPTTICKKHLPLGNPPPRLKRRHSCA